MKRIRFIAPVEAIQGNMSGRQTLKYADHDNPAYDAPKNKRSYARNYRPSYIGAFVAGTGVKYFAVKTKSAVRPTTKSLLAMALQGGAGALYAKLISDQSAEIYQNAQAIWESQNALSKVTMRKFYTDLFRSMLENKIANVTARSADGLLTLTIENPWVSTELLNLTVSNEVLVKFWTQLSPSGAMFRVDNQIGVARVRDTFNDIIQSNHNVLGLVASGETDVEFNGRLVKDSHGAAVAQSDPINFDIEYTTGN